MGELPLIASLVQKDIMIIVVAARNVIKDVQHAMEELPQTVRHVSQDITRMIIVVAAKNVMDHVQHAKEVKALIVYLSQL